MRIEEIETFIIGEWLVVRVRTDSGLDGMGEATFWAQPAATAEVVSVFFDPETGKSAPLPTPLRAVLSGALAER